MTVARVALLGLRVVLALCLGLGPLGAQTVGRWMHAPVCACGACDATGAESCCVPQAPDEGPQVRAESGGCGCALEAPADEAMPALPPHAAGRTAPRAAAPLATGPAVKPVVQGSIEGLVAFRARRNPPRAGPARGGARAARLGVWRL